MSLANVAYSPVLTWGNPTLRRLETQALVPLFGEAPVELGMSGREEQLLARLRAEPRYPKLFADAYPEARDPFSMDNVTKALACFERTLLSGTSPYDRYRSGADPNAISGQAKRGEALFFGERNEHLAEALRRSREMTRLYSRGVDHRCCRRSGRALVDAQEAPMQDLPAVVLSGPSCGGSATCVLAAGVPGSAANADAGVVAAT